MLLLLLLVMLAADVVLSVCGQVCGDVNWISHLVIGHVLAIYHRYDARGDCRLLFFAI